MTLRVALVLNPVSRQAGVARRAVEEACAAAGMGEPLVLTTTVARPGELQAREALAAGVERVVVAGGDGTVRLVAGVLAERAAATGAAATEAAAGAQGRPVLGVVPVGTANLFARGAGLPRRDVRAAARVAVTARGRPLDLGRARLVDTDGRVGDHPFLVVVGVGHDADVIADLDPRLKRRLRWLAYFEPGLRRLSRPGRPVTLVLDGAVERTEQLWSLLAVITARLPLGARVAPAARPDDGVLHVVLVAPRGLRDWGRVARTGLGGRHTPHPALRYEVGRELTVRPAEPAVVQVDGDVVPAIVSARITIEPGALTVAVP